MEKIIGIDLGTNSIGWAIRETSNNRENQIIDKGVLTFEKGVASNKGVEEPKVKKRTESRSKRRNYQAEKYRKWALLKLLIENKMCPLTKDELKLWSSGDWQDVNGKVKNLGRKYPQSEKFVQWLRFDFDGDGKPDFERLGFSKHENCYLFRWLAISENAEHKLVFQENAHLLGRVFYQIVQRRGFKGRDEDEAKAMLEGSEETGTKGRNDIEDRIKEHKTLGAALYYLNKDGFRIRKRYNLRKDFENELIEICRVQNLTQEFYNRLHKAIIWQRDLRSQKGLVGLCTFEKNKSRCPVSHPLYEEFRTWVFINNLKIQAPEGKDRMSFIHDKIYPIFYRASDFYLSDIAKVLDKEGGKIAARFPHGEKDEKGKYKKDAPDTKVVAAKLMYRLKEFYGNDWKEKLGWTEALHDRKKPCSYSFEDIWHVLLTFNDKDKLIEFAKDKLNLSDDDGIAFSKIPMQQGYATLSLSAIKKILPYLHQGYIYSEAIYLANLHKVLGATGITPELIAHFTGAVREIMKKSKTEKTLIGTVNGMIAAHINSEHRYFIEDNRELDEAELNAIEEELIKVFGERTWNELSEREKEENSSFVGQRFRAFLMKPLGTKKESLFLRVPRLHDQIFDWLKDSYQVPESKRNLLWHPSEQETYPDAKEYHRYTVGSSEHYVEKLQVEKFLRKYPEGVWDGVAIRQLGDPQPIRRGFKNPMALKTLHKLKYLINYLIKEGKIDEETRVVVEIARELNDANRRKAIEKWQRDREKENEEFAKAIIGTAKIKYPDLNETAPSVINKFRLWFDQIENGQEVLKQVKALKDDVAKLRLWNEQKGQCLYTGKMISLTELFDGTKFDFEHTIPASVSFDNELKNLTISDATYNRQIKQKLLPSELPNYHKDVNGYSAIQPRLQFLKDKVRGLEKLYLEWQKKTSDNKEIKDAIIQRRHLLKMDLDYWKYKLQTFTCAEYKPGWRNSQLRDTQIITKYALPYLKTVFKKTEVQKGSVTAAFREIYNVSPRLEPKDRTKHSHHAIDAAVLTLIPSASIRDQILLRYNEEKDLNPSNIYHESVRGWSKFNPIHILSIENEVLINNLPEHRTLTSTFKKVRKRGKIQYVRNQDGSFKKDENGSKIPMMAQGDTIRGQLHGESIFGAIKLPQRDENGKIKFDTEHKIIQEEKETLVIRKPLVFKKNATSPGFRSLEEIEKVIINKPLFEIIEKQCQNISFEDALNQGIWMIDRKGNKVNKIRNIRCKKPSGGGGFLSIEKAIEVRSQNFKSSKPYKQFQYAENETNPLCLFYEKELDGKFIRAFQIINLFDLAKLKMSNESELRQNPAFSTLNVSKTEVPLLSELRVGTKCIFFEKEISELRELEPSDLFKRAYYVYKFNLMGTPYIYMQNHLVASGDELGDGETIFKVQSNSKRLKLKADKFTCAIEGKHFGVKPDGEIIWTM